MKKTTSGFAPYGRQTHTGFTIVELLIVIVVIAILAAISVVAYTGVQNRANDTAVQSDISNLAKKIQVDAAVTGQFIAGGATRTGPGVTTGASNTFPGFTFSPAKSAYVVSADADNLHYCTGIETASGQAVFRIRARSRSGNSFEYSSVGGMQSLGNVITGGVTLTCRDLNYPFTFSYGLRANGTWNSWTDN